MTVLLKKLADLAGHLDQKGYSEEAHQVDHIIKSIASDDFLLHRMLDVKPRESPGYGQDNSKGMIDEAVPEPKFTEKAPATPPANKQPVSLSIIKSMKEKGIDEKRIKYLIYSQFMDPSTAASAAESKTLDQAIQDGLKTRALVDDSKKLLDPRTWAN